jgi:hypothetical protein
LGGIFSAPFFLGSIFDGSFWKGFGFSDIFFFINQLQVKGITWFRADLIIVSFVLTDKYISGLVGVIPKDQRLYYPIANSFIH